MFRFGLRLGDLAAGLAATPAALGNLLLFLDAPLSFPTQGWYPSEACRRWMVAANACSEVLGVGGSKFVRLVKVAISPL